MSIPAEADDDKTHVDSCSTQFDLTRPNECLVKIDLGAILAEMRETNRAIREDQRALLNQLCKSIGNHPEKCDDTLPGTK